MLVGGMDILGVYCADMTATIGKQVMKAEKVKDLNL
jgi:hypothetical protein